MLLSSTGTGASSIFALLRRFLALVRRLVGTGGGGDESSHRFSLPSSLKNDLIELRSFFTLFRAGNGD